MPQVPKSNQKQMCPTCHKVFDSKQALGGHVHIHKKESATASKEKLDAVDICAIVMAAHLPDKQIPTNKLGAWFRWVKATQTFLEELDNV